MVYWIFGTNTSCPSKAILKGNFEPNSGHKQTKLLTRSPYSVFGKWKWTVKAKSASLFRNTPILTFKLCKTGLWLAQKNTWFSKTKVILFFENLASNTMHRTQMIMFWRRYNDLFTRCLNVSLIYIQFHHRWPKRNMGHLWHNMRAVSYTHLTLPTSDLV